MIKFPWNKDPITGMITEILEKLKKLANPNCNKCYGRGHIGYKVNKVSVNGGRVIRSRTYIACPKCIEKRI